LSEREVLDNLYRLAIDIGTCPERDYYMYGNHDQNGNLMTKNRASRKANFPNAITRAQSDNLFLLQLVDNPSMPPWFVACCQIIWRNKTAEERAKAVEEMCSKSEERSRDPDPAKPPWVVPPLIVDVTNRVYGELTFDPFALRGSIDREERDADVAAGAKGGTTAGKPASSQPGKGKGGKGGKPPARSRSPRSPTYPPGDLGKGGNKGRGGGQSAKGKGKGKDKGKGKGKPSFDEWFPQSAHDFWG
jgi:hypothetical protein